MIRAQPPETSHNKVCEFFRFECSPVPIRGLHSEQAKAPSKAARTTVPHRIRFAQNKIIPVLSNPNFRCLLSEQTDSSAFRSLQTAHALRVIWERRCGVTRALDDVLIQTMVHARREGRASRQWGS